MENEEYGGDEMITAQCKDCEEVKEVYRDSGLCEECEDHYVYCGICDEHHQKDDVCQHVFWDGMKGWWAGPGADDPCYNQIEAYREAVVFALRQLKPDVLDDLCICLQNGTLQFCLCGTTFGVDTIEFTGRDDARASIYHQNIIEDMNDKVNRKWTEEQSHWFEIGFEWLMSLDKKTPRENALVLQWIEEMQ